jgi:hypothetical protein
MVRARPYPRHEVWLRNIGAKERLARDLRASPTRRTCPHRCRCSNERTIPPNASRGDQTGVIARELSSASEVAAGWSDRPAPPSRPWPEGRYDGRRPAPRQAALVAAARLQRCASAPGGQKRASRMIRDRPWNAGGYEQRKDQAYEDYAKNAPVEAGSLQPAPGLRRRKAAASKAQQRMAAPLNARFRAQPVSRAASRRFECPRSSPKDRSATHL